MLQFFRDKLQGIVVWSIIILIILVFVLSAGNYLFKHNYNDSLAKIDDESINLSIVNQRYQEEIKQHYSKKNYAKVDLNPSILKKQIFYGMLNQLATIKGLEKSNFAVTIDQLLGVVKNNQNLYIDGKFSKTKYLDWLRSLGINELAYQNFLRQNLLMQQLSNIVLLTNFVPMSEVEDFISKWFEQRKCGYTIVPKSRFAKMVPTEQQLEEYYIKHKKDFFLDSTVKIQYIEVSSKDLLEKVQANEKQLLEYYNNNLGYYTLPELVNVRHILIKEDAYKDPNKFSKTQENAIVSKDKIENILKKLKAGENFQELAKKFSQDNSSASKGGDLGWIGKGEIDDLEFENAAFGLKQPGSYSEVIKSKFGHHILQLVEKRASKVSKFKDVADKVQQHYKEEQIQPQLQDLYEKLADASEKNIELAKLGADLGVTVKQTNSFTSKGEANGITSYSEVVTAAFEQKELNTNSAVIRIADDHFIVFRVIEKNSGRNKFFIEAADEIKQILINTAAMLEVEKYSQTLATKLAKTRNPSGVAKLHNLEWKEVEFKRDNKVVPPEVVKFGFTLTKPNTQKIFKMNSGDFLILQLKQITNPDINKLLKQDPEIKNKLQDQLTQLAAYIEEKLYEQDLYNNAKIKFTKNIDKL